MISLERQIPGLDDTLVLRVVEKLLAFEPEATAVLLTGSFVKGTAALGSDLDLMAVTPSPRVGYRTWFEERAGDAPLHVSAGATTAEEWLANGAEPARWALGFPAVNAASYICTDEATRQRLGPDPSLRHPPGGAELEDFLESVGKAKRAGTEDELGLRWFAQSAATLAPSLVIPINAPRIVSDRRQALAAALELSVAPEHYGEDIAVCFGLAAALGGEVKSAVARLGREMLAFLRENAPGVDTQPEISRYLVDGTLERHLGLLD